MEWKRVILVFMSWEMGSSPTQLTIYIYIYILAISVRQSFLTMRLSRYRSELVRTSFIVSRIINTDPKYFISLITFCEKQILRGIAECFGIFTCSVSILYVPKDRTTNPNVVEDRIRERGTCCRHVLLCINKSLNTCGGCLRVSPNLDWNILTC